MKRQCARQSIPLHHHHRISIRLKMLPGTKRCDLRQHIITALCYLLRYPFDLAFVLDRSPMLTLLPWLSGIPRRVGPDSLGRGFSLTDRVPVSSSPTHLQHQAEVYLDLARAIGLPVDTPRMRFEPTAQERQSVSRPSRLRIALFTGGGSNPGMVLTAKR